MRYSAAWHELAANEDSYAEWLLPFRYGVRTMDRASRRRGFAKAG